MARLLLANAGKRCSSSAPRRSSSAIISANEANTRGSMRAFASKSTGNKGTFLVKRETKAKPNAEAESITGAESARAGEPNVEFTTIYVHPLSQIVLRHLQTKCHEWVCAKRLDHNLVLHRDGTFMLECPRPKDVNATVNSHRSSLRIWTYYDGEDRKHWLSVAVDQVQHRFLLQDNLLPAWQGQKRCSLPERIQASIQDLMDAVDELEA